MQHSFLVNSLVYDWAVQLCYQMPYVNLHGAVINSLTTDLQGRGTRL